MKGKRNEHMDTCIKNEILITIYQVCVQQCFANLKNQEYFFSILSISQPKFVSDYPCILLKFIAFNSTENIVLNFLNPNLQYIDDFPLFVIVFLRYIVSCKHVF